MDLSINKFKNCLEQNFTKFYSILILLIIYSICLGLSIVSLFWLFSIPDLSCYYLTAVTFLKTILSGGYLVEDLDIYLLTENHFNWLVENVGYLFFFIFFLLFLLASICLYLLKKVKQSIFKINSVNFPWKFTLLFFGVWIILKFFLYHYLPLHIDEVFDFIYFSKKSFILRQSYIFNNGEAWFNNHVLYTHFSAFFHYLGCSDKLSIRLPAVLSEFVLFFYLIYVFRKNNLLYFLLAGLLSSFWLGLYSVEGRSYYLIASCFILLVIESYRFYTSPSVKHLLYFTLLAIIGLAANKLFIIPLSGVILLEIIVVIKQRKLITEAILALLLIFIGGVLLYLPAFILGGVSTFFVDLGNSGNLISLFPLFLQNLSVITGLNSKAYLGIIFLFFLFLISYNKLSAFSRFLVFQFLAQLLVLIVFIFLSQEYLPFRAMIYLSALFSISLSSIVYDLSPSFNLNYSISLTVTSTLLLINTLFLYQNTWLRKYPRFIFDRHFYAELNKNIALIAAEAPTSVYLLQKNNYYFFYLKLYLGEQVNIMSTPLLNDEADVIISPELMINKTLIFYDDLNELYIYR